MEITKEFIEKCTIMNEGTTSYIMLDEFGVTHKIYKSTLPYIAGNIEYPLNEEDTKNRLEYIVSQKNNVSLTDLPKDILTCNGKPIGVSISYYESSTTLKDYLNNNPEIDLLKIKQETEQIVGELIKNGIVPTDPHFENFLVTHDTLGNRMIKMVDMDDNYVSVYPNQSRDFWYESEVETCYRVLNLSFEQISSKKQV